jgi:hypothetical protein
MTCVSVQFLSHMVRWSGHRVWRIDSCKGPGYAMPSRAKTPSSGSQATTAIQQDTREAILQGDG